MRDYSLTHLSDDVLLRDLVRLIAQDRATTATLLAHVAEVDARRLFVPAGYPSMHAYCVGELRLSEDAASRRIQAARAARQFPALFTAIAEGRIHLTGVCLLAPHLTPENVLELLTNATHRRKFQIEELLSRRFPGSEQKAADRAVVRALPAVEARAPQSALAHVDCLTLDSTLDTQQPPAETGKNHELPALPPTQRFLVRLTIGNGTHEKLRYAQALLSHAVPSGDVAEVLDRALDALITQLEKRKVGAGTLQRRSLRRCSSRDRHVPAHVRRAVWGRDQGQCTFVSASGHRCEARRFLEFDHVDPVARGGKATVERMRLRCRAHNQHEAERAFGAEFMSRKRDEAKRTVAEARARAVTQEKVAEEQAAKERAAQERAAQERAARERAAREQAAREQTLDVLAGLRSLGCRADVARRAVAFTESLQSPTLEERMRAALMYIGRGPRADTSARTIPDASPGTSREPTPTEAQLAAATTGSGAGRDLSAGAGLSLARSRSSSSLP